MQSTMQSCIMQNKWDTNCDINTAEDYILMSLGWRTQYIKTATWDLIHKWRSLKVRRLLMKMKLYWTSDMFSKRTRPKGRMAAGLLLLIFYQIKIKVTKNSCWCNPNTLGSGCKFHTTALLSCPNDEWSHSRNLPLCPPSDCDLTQ